jgi:hypothetical protein
MTETVLVLGSLSVKDHAGLGGVNRRLFPLRTIRSFDDKVESCGCLDMHALFGPVAFVKTTP